LVFQKTKIFGQIANHAAIGFVEDAYQKISAPKKERKKKLIKLNVKYNYIFFEKY